MASVNDTVRDLIARYPCGYQNRTQALHQILVVLGAGYEWRDGEAVTRYPDADTCVGLHERFKYPPEEVAELRAIGIEPKERFITGRCSHEDLRAHAEELALVPGPLGQEAYPPCDMTLVLTVPDDVKPDWAAAVAEIASVVAPLWSTDLEHQGYLRRLKPHQQGFVAGVWTQAADREQA